MSLKFHINNSIHNGKSDSEDKKIKHFENVDQISYNSDESKTGSPQFSVDNNQLTSDTDDTMESDHDVSNDDEEITNSDDQLDSFQNECKNAKDSAILDQFELFDALLSCRMMEQEMLMSVNKLPLPTNYQEITTSLGSLYNQQLEKTKRNLKILLKELLHMQTILMNIHENKLFADSQMDEDNVVQIDQELNLFKNLEATLMLRHSKFEESRNKILLDAFNRVNLFIPISTNDNFKTGSTNILTQIKQMMIEKSRFIEKTRVQRSLYKIIGNKESTKNLNEIFDDDDFYHQLLVEMTKRKTSNLKDMMAISRHWSQINKITKLKKNIDSKASKGRKTIYTVHKKLINFMASKENVKSYNQRDGLFQVLFSSKEQTQQEINWMFK